MYVEEDFFICDYLCCIYGKKQKCVHVHNNLSNPLEEKKNVVVVKKLKFHSDYIKLLL